MQLGRINSTLVSLTAPDSFAAEQYQGLRLKVEALKRTRGVSVLAVTSPGVSDGKTVTSINLACALARGSGTRVLLIDADLRRPAVEAHLGLHASTGIGLTEALRDERIGLRQIVRAINHGSSVSVVPAGSSRIHVPELLRSPRFESLLQEARSLYDFVVLDTPPLAPVYDAAVLSRLVDGILIVVAAHETPRKLLEQTMDLVDESKVLGFVFNGDDSTSSRKYDAYYKS
jgi:capsular exopolysaccharide synthesis family protein